MRCRALLPMPSTSTPVYCVRVCLKPKVRRWVKSWSNIQNSNLPPPPSAQTDHEKRTAYIKEFTPVSLCPKEIAILGEHPAQCLLFSEIWSSLSWLWYIECGVRILENNAQVWCCQTSRWRHSIHRANAIRRSVANRGNVKLRNGYASLHKILRELHNVYIYFSYYFIWVQYSRFLSFMFPRFGPKQPNRRYYIVALD